jgi:hypothetical protein
VLRSTWQWRKAGNLAAALGIAGLGVAAALFGEADDAPGLVLLGGLLIVSGCARREDRPAQQVAPTAVGRFGAQTPL